MSIPCRTAAHQVYHQMRMSCPVCGIPAVHGARELISADMVDVLRTKIEQSVNHATLPVSKIHRSTATRETVSANNLQKSQFSQNRPLTPYAGAGAGLQALRLTARLDVPKNLKDIDTRVSRTSSLSEISTPLRDENETDMLPHTIVTLRARLIRLVPRIVHFTPGNSRLRKRFMEMTSKICLPCLTPSHNDSQTSLSGSLDPNKGAYSTTNATLRKIKNRLNVTKPRIVSSMPTNERLRSKFSALLEGKSL